MTKEDEKEKFRRIPVNNAGSSPKNQPEEEKLPIDITSSMGDEITDMRVDQTEMQGNYPGVSSDYADSSATEPGECEKLKQELKQSEERYLRIMADFDNYRKRMERDYTRLSAEGKKQFLIDFFPVIDALETGLQAGGASASQEWIDGMEAVRKAFQGVLSRHGVKPLEVVNKPFDPNFQEAVGCVRTKDRPEGIVYDVIRNGYTFNDELIRPAQVRVTKK